ncbi:MAG: radical SAM protein [Oligoflexia bacterium]|nr:radical SAM protein [Oligoflexia bacterium]
MENNNNQHTSFPLIYITNQCNLNCSYCFIKKKTENKFFISKGEFRNRLSHLLNNDRNISSLNFTGGEPTLHPQLLDLIDITKENNIETVIINSNGIELSNNEQLLQELNNRGVVLALSINSLPLNKSQERLFAQIKKIKMPVIIITVISNQNKSFLKELNDFMFATPEIIAIEIQPIVFSGENLPKSEEDKLLQQKNKCNYSDIINELSSSSSGKINTNTFCMAGGCNKSCYQVCYFLTLEDGSSDNIPFSHFLDIKKLENLLKNSIVLKIDSKVEDFINETIYDLWANDGEYNEIILARLKKLLKELFSEKPLTDKEKKMTIAKYFKTIGIHNYMDCYTYNQQRVAACSRHILLSGGKKVSVCMFNNIINEKDEFIF